MICHSHRCSCLLLLLLLTQHPTIVAKKKMNYSNATNHLALCLDSLVFTTQTLVVLCALSNSRIIFNDWIVEWMEMRLIISAFDFCIEYTYISVATKIVGGSRSPSFYLSRSLARFFSLTLAHTHSILSHHDLALKMRRNMPLPCVCWYVCVHFYGKRVEQFICRFTLNVWLYSWMALLFAVEQMRINSMCVYHYFCHSIIQFVYVSWGST